MAVVLDINQVKVEVKVHDLIRLHELYIDAVTCDVVPLDVCQVILGGPYLWDRVAVLSRRKQK